MVCRSYSKAASVRNAVSTTVASSNLYQKARDDLQEEGSASEMGHGSHPLQGVQLNGSPFSFFDLRVLRGDREWMKSMGQEWQSRVCIAVEWADVFLLSSGQCNTASLQLVSGCTIPAIQIDSLIFATVGTWNHYSASCNGQAKGR